MNDTRARSTDEFSGTPEYDGPTSGQRLQLAPCEVRTVAVQRRAYRRMHLRMWRWTPVIGGGWRTFESGYTFTKAGAVRAGRRWHADQLRQLAHIRRPADYYPAGGDCG